MEEKNPGVCGSQASCFNLSLTHFDKVGKRKFLVDFRALRNANVLKLTRSKRLGDTMNVVDQSKKQIASDFL